MDESRKQYERFLREEHLYTDEELVWEDGRNCYSIYPVHIAWKCWKASRESIEIELPKRMVLVGLEDIDRTLTAINAGMANVESVVRAAGIKVKE